MAAGPYRGGGCILQDVCRRPTCFSCSATMTRSALSSALTQALGGGSVKTTAPAPEPPRVELDPLAFPFLASPSNHSPIDGVTQAVRELNLGSLRSSAPTAKKGAGTTADYELGRAADNEVMPASLTNPSRNFLTEAVIGSLPRPLSARERQIVSASVPLSSTLSRLGSLPSNKVLSRTAEGQRLRDRVLRGAVLVFVTAGYSGKRFVYEKAKELGVRTVIIDGPESWSKELVAEGVAQKFIGLDMSDAETVFDRCLEAIKGVREELGEVDGVLSFCEMAQPLVARLAEQLGLPGNTPEAVDAARDKHATRQRMAEEGLPTPRNFLITSPDQLKAASDLVGYPAVIKPIYGAASIGVVRVDDFEHLKTAYARVCKDLAAARVVAGALLEGNTDEEEEETDHKGNASSWIKTTIMMEEYLDGPEVDVDLVFSEGRPVYGAVNDNWPTVEPWFNETGSNGPSVLPLQHQRELAELAVKTVQALGFKLGVFHVELKYTSRGARLIEVNCRMGGGVVRNMNLLVWGVDMVEEQLLCSAGVPSRPLVAAKPLMNVAEYLVNAMHTGILRDTHFLDKYQGNPDIIYARAMVEPGTKVVCVEDGLPTWVCQVLVTRPTVEEAMQLVTEIEAEIQKNMPIDPLPKH